MNFSFINPWHEFLPREGGHVVGFCGSGGKTSLMLALSVWYRQEGIPLILTTTTRTEPLDDCPVVDFGDPDAAGRIAAEPVVFLRARVGPDEKWMGLAPADVDQLGEEHPDRLVLVEVDGAGKKPIKFYKPGEPVWPARTSLAMVVLGLSALGAKVQDAVFRFGRQDFSPLSELAPDQEWTWDHYLSVLGDAGGYLDQVPANVPAALILAGMGDLQDSIGLFDFMGKAMAHPRIPLALFCETMGDDPSFRAVCRQDEEDTGDGEEL